MDILLIGNGFDLAHGLPTSYNDFLNFCQKTRRIYTYAESATKKEYEEHNLNGWEINDYIKEQLLVAFENRKYNKILQDDGTYKTEVSSLNDSLDKLYTYMEHNTWIEYFLNTSSYIGENWIDFETEISNVIQALDRARVQVKGGGSVTTLEEDDSKILTAIWKASRWSLKTAFKDVVQIDKFTIFLNEELERLIGALEIYLSSFVGKIEIKGRSLDIEGLSPDGIISFNYSDTYERAYGIGNCI